MGEHPHEDGLPANDAEWWTEDDAGAAWEAATRDAVALLRVALGDLRDAPPPPDELARVCDQVRAEKGLVEAPSPGSPMRASG